MFTSSHYDKVQLNECLHKMQSFKRRHDSQHNDTQHNDTRHNDTQHNDTQHSDTQHNDTQHNNTKLLVFVCRLSFMLTHFQNYYAGCRQSECHYGERCVTF